MADSVFVDTSGWYALIDRRDAWHPRARREVERLLGRRAELVTSDYVVDECATLTKARAGARAALRLLDLLHESRAVRWEWVDAERFARAETLFRKHRDHGYSFTDCVSFALMRELRIQAALTSDEHFETAGFQRLLTSPGR